MAVPHAYGLSGDLKGEELKKVLEWLIGEGKMLHTLIEVKVSVYL